MFVCVGGFFLLVSDWFLGVFVGISRFLVTGIKVECRVIEDRSFVNFLFWVGYRCCSLRVRAGWKGIVLVLLLYSFRYLVGVDENFVWRKMTLVRFFVFFVFVYIES